MQQNSFVQMVEINVHIKHYDFFYLLDLLLFILVEVHIKERGTKLLPLESLVIFGYYQTLQFYVCM